jgi:hypothetical protein
VRLLTAVSGRNPCPSTTSSAAAGARFAARLSAGRTDPTIFSRARAQIRYIGEFYTANGEIWTDVRPAPTLGGLVDRLRVVRRPGSGGLTLTPRCNRPSDAISSHGNGGRMRTHLFMLCLLRCARPRTRTRLTLSCGSALSPFRRPPARAPGQWPPGQRAFPQCLPVSARGPPS